MEIKTMVGLGDQLAATAVYRELKRKLPNENIRVRDARTPEILRGNPHLNVGNHENGMRVEFDSPAWGERIAQHYVDVLRRKHGIELGTFDDTPELFLTSDELANGYGISSKKSVAISADAGWPTRRWAYFDELARMLLARGWDVYHVGSDGNPPLPCTRSFHNKLKVRESAALLTRVGRVVCNDTGLFHLAAAVGVPCVTIFGFIPADQRAYATTRAIENGRCESRCRYTGCSKFTARCARLDDLSVKKVFAEVVR